MPTFRYRAINASGKPVRGKRSAEIVHQVESWLVENKMTPIRIDIVTEQEAAGAADLFTRLKMSLAERFSGVTIDDLILFCRQLGTMLSAGVAVLQALEIMTRQTINPRLGKLLTTIGAELESGSSMSDAFSLFPRTFNRLFINIVRIGEETGNLNRSFDYLADLYENEKDTRERIKTATRYPKLVVMAIVGAVAFLMTFVVPKFVTLFANSKVALPLPTQFLIAASNFMSHNFLGICVAAALAVMAWHYALQYETVVLARDRLLLRLPVIGELSKKIYLSRFCRVLAVLGKSGIDIINALRLAASALDNQLLFRMAGRMLDDVEEGVPLNIAMAKHPHFPAMVVQMVAVGEETGELDALLDKVADYYDTETNYTIKNLATLIEPLLLLVMGCVVGLIALAIFMPMWDMMNVMRG